MSINLSSTRITSRIHSTINITNLPPEILQHLSKFLNCQDLCQFQSSCKPIRESIDLALVNKSNLLRPLKNNWVWTNRDDVKHLWTRLELISPQKTHTVIFTCEFRDQGWGNQKGFIHIAEHSEGDTGKIQIDNIICSSPRANHHWIRLRLEFQPDPKKKYSLWYQVGGGGGHELRMRSPSLRNVIHGSLYAKIVNADLPLTNDFCRNMFQMVMEQMIMTPEPDSRIINKDVNVKVDEDKNDNNCKVVSLFRDFLGVELSTMDDVRQITTFLQDYEKMMGDMKMGGDSDTVDDDDQEESHEDVEQFLWMLQNMDRRIVDDVPDHDRNDIQMVPVPPARRQRRSVYRWLCCSSRRARLESS